ncbi:M23 protein [Murid betaherpesvirus 1]|uniref:US22 family protein n=4 Tax=Murid herpesvirus 1 TaxID=10366 RepID=H2A179_MUHVS|nr:US22 family protein [Murid betaherpesvirus 1]YP_214031.1 US22 family homolog [Murid betaherpesvirus 1]ACE95204.1 M23 [Muromegalovirus G4]ACE95531.1 M23 [Muromegalovirus C4A]ADD10401.1 US22 family protein [Murid betaherpesvirus 1]AQQ81412.1 M23 protein [Murid betaherpesvirus 1]AWV68446.1 M23 protein [Murid betaherpesvirus 1]
MAPPEALESIFSDFATVEAAVAANIGRRVRLHHPKGLSLCIGMRWREIPAPANGGPPNECARLAALLCCHENIKFIGSVVASDSNLEGRQNTRSRLLNWRFRNTGGGGGGDDTRGPRDPDEGLVSAAVVAAAAILGPALRAGGGAIYAPMSELPHYRQPPEVYVGSSGKIYIYLLLTRSEAFAHVADSMREIVKDGIKNIYLPVRRPIICRGAASRELTECRTNNDILSWRERNLANRVFLGDKSELSACDEFFVGYDVVALDGWAAEADVGAMDVLGIIIEPLMLPPLTILTDDLCRVYVVQGVSSLCLIAEDYFEFVERGISRYHKNRYFIIDPLEAMLTKKTECPNNFLHSRATNGVPHGSEPTWEKKTGRNSMRKAVNRLMRSIKRR